MNIIYNDHLIQYDQADQEYGGIQDFISPSILTNSLVENKKTSNKIVINTKTANNLIDSASISETKYWRIYAGMPMGLLLSLTYPADQDGEIRN